MKKRRVVVGFSGGVTSAWCAGWALRTYPKDEVVFLFHDTKEEHEDTYRFNREISRVLGHPITEQSDGRSVTELVYDEGAIPNQRMAFCSRILKAEQWEKYRSHLEAEDVTEIIKVLGFTSEGRDEWARIQRHTMKAELGGYSVRFPLVENKVSKQEAADWCLGIGVRPSAMYLWSDHANCVGCVRGGKAYWLAVKENEPEAYERRAALEREFGHTILKDISLDQLPSIGLKRAVNRRESIDIGPCECGS